MFRRQPILPLLVAALAVAMFLPGIPAGAHESAKQEVVRANLTGTAYARDAGAILAAVPGARAMHGLEWRATGEFPELIVRLAGSTPCEVFTLDAGRKLVCDFHNAIILVGAPKVREGDSRLISGIRSSLYQFEPAFISRIVLDLATPCNYEMARRDGGLTVTLSAKEHAQGSTELARVHVRFEAVAAETPKLSRRWAEDLAAVADAPATLAAETEAVETTAVSTPVVDEAEPQALPATARLRQELAMLMAPVTPEARPRPVQRLSLDLQAVADAQPRLLLPSETPYGTTDLAGQDATAQPAILLGQLDPPLAEDDPLDITEAETAAEPEPAVTEAEPADIPAADADDDEEEEPLPPPARRPAPDTTEANTALTTVRRALEGLTQAEDAGAATPETVPAVAAPPVTPKPQWRGDPMKMPVNLDFRDMEMANVVAILASMADINVIAGTQLTGTVTLSLKDVPLRQAIETVLRINGLGLVEDHGIYRIVSFEESVAAGRVTRIVALDNATPTDLKKVLEDVLVGSIDQRLVSISANDKTGVLIIAGPEARVNELVSLAQNLDVAEPILPTVTEAIKLNYAEPQLLVELVKTMLTPDLGQVSADERARFLVVTDAPAVVEQVRMLVKQLDLAVKQVAIDSMVVDAVLADSAETGIDWLLTAVRRQSRRDAAFGTGRAVGNLQELAMDTALGLGDTAGALTFGILSSDFDIRGTIQAEVRNQNGTLLSNPTIVTVENKPAQIVIAQEIPYIELTETAAGGSQTNTEFKEVGTVLEVTPRVTHDDHIIVDVSGKESGTAGEFNGVPIEDKREVSTTIRVKNGQTIFIGGLRKNDRDTTIRKVPILGDIPGIDFLFRQDVRSERINELLIFLTCNVLPDEVPPLSAHHEQQYGIAEAMPMRPTAHPDQVRDYMRPSEMRDPIWKVRRSD